MLLQFWLWGGGEAARTTFDSCAPTEDKWMAERVLQRMTSVNVYLSLAVPVNKPISRAFARRLDTQSVEKSVSVNSALHFIERRL